MFLTATDQKIEAVLSGAVAANQVQFVAAYADITTTTFVPGQNDGVTNDTTDVDVVTAPASSTQRQIKSLSFYNADSSPAEITVKLDNGGTERVLIKNTLQPGDTLSWAVDTGWVKGIIGSPSFLDLPDTPSSYSGHAGAIPAVNSGETALEFVTVANSVFGRTGAVTAQSGDYDAGQIDETSSAKIMTGSERTKLAGIESGAEVNDVDSVFGRTGVVTAQSGDYNFLQLGDTPGNYTGDANKVAAVNSAENAVEFTDTLLMGDGTEANPAFSFAADPDTGMFHPAADTLGLVTGGAEHWRLRPSGDLQTGNTGAGSPIGSSDGIILIGVGSVGVSRTDSAAGFFARRNTNGDVIVFRKGTTGVGSISVDGSSTSYNTTSDHRLKENDTPISDAATRLRQLRPVRFKFKGEAGMRDGFLAHEVESVLPEAVTGEKDAVDESGDPVPQMMDYSKLTPLLTAAIQELESRIAQLENSSAARQ